MAHVPIEFGMIPVEQAIRDGHETRQANDRPAEWRTHGKTSRITRDRPKAYEGQTVARIGQRLKTISLGFYRGSVL
jgi:hypothetical protein